jgi:putative endonuclease
MARHNQLGKKGEEIAAGYLRGKGYIILDRNWRHEKDEIDIIALEDEVVVIVEVKTRGTDFFGEPEEAVDNRKQQYLVRASEAYLIEKNLEKEIRFDIISIIINGNKQILRHIRDAFYPTLQE